MHVVIIAYVLSNERTSITYCLRAPRHNLQRGKTPCNIIELTHTSQARELSVETKCETCALGHRKILFKVKFALRLATFQDIHHNTRLKMFIYRLFILK